MHKNIIFSMVGVSKSFQNNKQVLKETSTYLFTERKTISFGLNGSGKYDDKLLPVWRKTIRRSCVFSGYSVGYLGSELHLDDTKTVKEVNGGRTECSRYACRIRRNKQ